MSDSLLSVAEILIRIVCATICGGAVGLERNFNGQYAGFRTHALVAGGAALFTIISLLCGGGSLSTDGSGLFNGECGRIAAQIVSGIGFIGAGTIIKSNFGIRGVTTAACLWFATALGMACAVNLILIAFIATILELVLVFGGTVVEKRLPKRSRFRLTAEFEDYHTLVELRDLLLQNERRYKVTMQNIAMGPHWHSVKVIFNIRAYEQDLPEDGLPILRKLAERFPDASFSCEN